MPFKQSTFQPYTYVKQVAVIIPDPPIQPDPPPQPPKRKLALKLAPPILITLGSLLIANVSWPIISYQLFTAPNIQKQEFIAPIPRNELAMFLPPPQAESSMPQAIGADVDYTNPQNWFPQAQYNNPTAIQVYTLNIPKLNIVDAKVIIGGDDLDKSLIQYPDTSLPGQLGSPVIFGHSVLRQFYNPSTTNKDRYVSIFSKIMTLTSGDRIYVDYDGIRYTYEVREKVEVQPDDLFILEQRYNNRELKLITCTPEGTYLRRGVVVAQLVDLTQEEAQELEF